MSSVAATSLSGLYAASQQLNASAANTANVLTTGKLPASGAAPSASDPYRPVTTAQSSQGSNGGVSVSLRPINPPFVAQYNPDATGANDQGLVGAPNVDLGSEVVNQKLAQFSYQANVAVLKTSDEMQKSLLDIVG